MATRRDGVAQTSQIWDPNTTSQEFTACPCCGAGKAIQSLVDAVTKRGKFRCPPLSSNTFLQATRPTPKQNVSLLFPPAPLKRACKGEPGHTTHATTCAALAHTRRRHCPDAPASRAGFLCQAVHLILLPLCTPPAWPAPVQLPGARRPCRPTCRAACAQQRRSWWQQRGSQRERRCGCQRHDRQCAAAAAAAGKWVALLYFGQILDMATCLCGG